MQRGELRVAILIVAGTLLVAACNVLKVFEKPNDAAIRTEIQAKLFEDSVLKTRDIHVVTQEGVVVLTGTVASELEKAAVERFAGKANGVKQVIDQLAVAGTTTASFPAPEAPTPVAAGALAAARVRSAGRQGATNSTSPLQAAAATPPAPLPEVRQAEPAPTLAPAPRTPERITVPAGTVFTVRMIDGIDTSRNRPGEVFAATIDAPVVVGDRVVIPRGADARVRLVEARSAGHVTGRSELQLELVGLSVGGNSYNVESGVHQQVGASRGARTAETVGGGAGLGALIGAIAGRGKGAAIGAAIGAGAGTAVQAATHGQQVRIPPETKLDFILKTPITLTLSG